MRIKWPPCGYCAICEAEWSNVAIFFGFRQSRGEKWHKMKIKWPPCGYCAICEAEWSNVAIFFGSRQSRGEKWHKIKIYWPPCGHYIMILRKMPRKSMFFTAFSPVNAQGCKNIVCNGLSGALQASWVLPATCIPARKLSRRSRGLSTDGGCCSKTSSPAAAGLPDVSAS